MNHWLNLPFPGGFSNESALLLIVLGADLARRWIRYLCVTFPWGKR